MKKIHKRKYAINRHKRKNIKRSPDISRSVISNGEHFNRPNFKGK